MKTRKPGARLSRFIACFAALAAAAGLGAAVQEETFRTPLPPAVLRAIINEASGELAFQNEVYLAGVNRNRKPQEYRQGYFETAFLLERLKAYGLDEAAVLDLPVSSKSTWDAEEAELWLVEPEPEKIADLKEVPACLASGSSSADVTAELVYVGPGNKEEHYAGRDVKGNIVLVNGAPDPARRLAVEKFGAAGLVAWSSSHPEFDRDQVGWSSIRPGEKEKPAFAFMISERRGQELRDRLERGERIKVRAFVKAGQVEGYKEQMVMGLIRGAERPEEELVFVAHLFEGFAKQGANDNISGCTAILETARVLKKLTAEGRLPALKRSVRFLFVPEISGSAAYLRLNPEIRKRMFACVNLDMVGEGLVKNLSWFRIYRTPRSLPSYLNDAAVSLVEWMGESQKAAQESGWRSGAILAPTGSRDPFYYQVEPYEGGSDHIVFIREGIPAVFFNVWPDQWYHTDRDSVDKSDPTQFKRTVVLSSALAALLADAGPAEAEWFAAEVSSRGLARLAADKRKAEGYILGAAADKVHQAIREARVVVDQAVAREKETLASAGFFAGGSAEWSGLLAQRFKALDGFKQAWLAEVEALYGRRLKALGLKPAVREAGEIEKRLSRLVPAATEKMRSTMGIWQLRAELQALNYQPAPAVMAVEGEIRAFIDGRRSILDIRDAVSAEFEPLNLEDVEKLFQAYEKLGLVAIRKK